MTEFAAVKYFPLDSDQFEYQFGIRPLLESESIVEATDKYHGEIDLKRKLIGDDREYCFESLAGSELPQREAMQLIFDQAGHLDAGYNKLTRESIETESASPLLEIALHVQEDLAIMSPDSGRGFPLVAGVICFPSGWSVSDKLGKSLLQIHGPVPRFNAQLGQTSELLMKRLKPGRPVWRMNWGVRPSGQLDQSPRHAEQLESLRSSINAANAGQASFFRVERQTLARLPESDHLLFAIHTHQCALKMLDDAQCRRLAAVIRSCPQAVLAYKGILPMRQAILGYLSTRSAK